jgi:hypothetical protein
MRFGHARRMRRHRKKTAERFSQIEVRGRRCMFEQTGNSSGVVTLQGADCSDKGIAECNADSLEALPGIWSQ